MVRNFLPFLRDRTGAVAIEFALWSTLFFLVALGAFDLGDSYFKRSNIGSAVSAASLQAFDQRTNVKFTELPAYVKAIAADDDLVVTVRCNGSSTACTNSLRSCACLNRAGTYVAKACGDSCNGSGFTSGVTAGYYLTITATGPSNPAILPGKAVGAELTQTATVRLE